MRQPAALYDIRHLLQAQLPHLPGRLRAVLALAHGLRGPRNPHTLRRLQRELLYDDADRIDSWGPGQELEVEGCFAPRLQWVRSWWVPTGGRELAQEPLVLAVDPTSKQDDLVALVISVVYRQHAHPGGSRVTWHIVRAQAKGSWIDHFCRLLRRLAPALPATVPVHVLCDQGLGSRDLWAQIVDLGWHPCLRYPPHVTFQPEGQTSRVPVRSLITGPGGLWVGTGWAFRDPPLEGTLIVLHAYGQAQPWVLLTDTPVAETEPTLYACRNWIEQGFRGLKTVGWKWHKTRRRDPTRVGRHWLVLAIATLLAVAYGTRREDAAARHLPPGRLRRPPAALTAAQQAALPPAATASCSRAWRCCGTCCCAAICGPACGCGRRPAPTSLPRGSPACGKWTPAAPELTRAAGAGLASHSSIALSTLRPPRSSASRGRQTGNSTPLEQARPHTAAFSRSRHAWPSHTRGRPTAPAASTDSRSENTLVKGCGAPPAAGPRARARPGLGVPAVWGCPDSRHPPIPGVRTRAAAPVPGSGRAR